ncbi:bacteriophage pi2 protein 37 [Streptococcus suis]|uniref:HK97 gp10 family phage protein n=1 Tax=Streptococcus suis TaxID=1307 RepID=UPI0005D2702B|nr:HK97 gp10 family phage protein [Streptococcus suis]CYY63068.1 bacteriophage pi2 protein 37 [Streptococcus suis]
MDLSQQLAQILSEYSNEIAEEVDSIAEEVAQETIKELRETSPKKTGKYSKGWRKKRLRNGAWVVYSFKYGPLTHLLEFGHIKRNGGRTKAHPHIKPAEINAIKKFTERIKDISK